MKNLDLTNFPKRSLDDWVKAAEKQLKNENPLAELSWNSLGIEALKPYYESSDLAHLAAQVDFFQKLPSHRWKLYEEVEVEVEEEANKKALEALMGGCDGIIFYTEKQVEIELLLKGIDPSICDLSILSVHGEQHSNHMNLKNTIIPSQPSGSPVEQLLEVIENISDQKHVHRHSFGDFFVEIASVRALRLLLNEKNTQEVVVHSQICLNPNPEYQWFLNTTAGLASILGGSHSISMPTVTGDSRITRNVGNLIRDESKIETYTDQCGGSYYVESLTAKIIEQVKARLK